MQIVENYNIVYNFVLKILFSTETYWKYYLRWIADDEELINTRYIINIHTRFVWIIIIYEIWFYRQILYN